MPQTGTRLAPSCEVRRIAFDEIEAFQNFAGMVERYADESAIPGMPRPNRQKEMYRQLEQAGPGDEQDSEEEELLGVADFLGKEEKKAAGDKNHGEEIGAQAKKKEKDASKVGASGADEVGFWVLGRLGVEGKVAGIEGKEGEQEKDARAKDGQGNDLLAEAGSGAGKFWFSQIGRAHV